MYMDFQSNHTGIETDYRNRLPVGNLGFQSNHTGIETSYNPSVEALRASSNRTILELKLFNKVVSDMHTRNFQSNHTGIETMEVGGLTLEALFFQSNHTGIETR